MVINTQELSEIMLQLDFERRWFPFKDYLKLLEDFLASEHKKLIDTVKLDCELEKITFPDNWSEREKYESISTYINSIDYAYYQFGNIFRKSFLIAMHASFEAFLVEEYKSYAKVNNTIELRQQGKASMLVKILKYLNQKEIISPIDGQKLEMLQRYTDIRDFITHADGKLENWNQPDTKRIKQIVKATDGLEWLTPNGERELVIEESYCYKILDMVRNLAEMVHAKSHG